MDLHSTSVTFVEFYIYTETLTYHSFPTFLKLYVLSLSDLREPV